MEAPFVQSHEVINRAEGGWGWGEAPLILINLPSLEIDHPSPANDLANISVAGFNKQSSLLSPRAPQTAATGYNKVNHGQEIAKLSTQLKVTSV